MILNDFSNNRANKLSKIIIPAIKEPFSMDILWLQYEDFNCPSDFFNNKLHKHNFYELHFILEGNGVFTDNIQNEYPINFGKAIFIPKNTPHTFKFKNENPKRFSIAFTFSEDIITNKFLNDFSIISLPGSIIKNLNEIFIEADKNTAFSLYVIRNRIFEILYEALSLNEYIDLSSALEPHYDNLYVDKAKKFINDNLNIIMTCKDIADYCHINEIYLNRLFKKHAGETLHKYIQRKKIDYSIELLKNKDLSLNAISAMLGFPNEYYFNTYFKKAIGLPPGAYRNKKITEE